MKKVIFMILCLFIVTSVHASEQLSFSVNFGVMTFDDFSFDPILWSAGVTVDFHLTELIAIAPEATLYGYKFEFKEFLLYPGVMLNITPEQFFVGAGVVKPIWITSGSGTTVSDEFALKIHAGYSGNGIKFTVYLLTDFNNLFSSNLIGATIGFGF
jgi:hypothetical protein